MFRQRESDNSADLESPGSGFLAPTRAWLSHTGDKIDVRSRSSSPAANEKKTSTAIASHHKDVSQGPSVKAASDGKKKCNKPGSKKI